MNNRRRITSVKPGRGPSFMGGIGSLVSIIFGIFWTFMAFQMTRPIGGPLSVFPLFGVLFILFGIVSAVYNFRNATASKRYSVVDITDSDIEPDPLNERFGEVPEERIQGQNRFCPYCGKDLSSDFRFCPICGKELPR